MKKFLFATVVCSLILIGCDKSNETKNNPNLYLVQMDSAGGMIVSNGGTVAFDARNSGVEAGMKVTYSVQMTDQANYAFSHWEVSSTVADFDISTLDGRTDTSISFVVPRGSVNGEVVVTVKPITVRKYKLMLSTASINPNTGAQGAVFLSPAATATGLSGQDVSTIAQKATQLITLTAPVVSLYTFLGWNVFGGPFTIVSGTQWDGDYATTTYGDETMTLYLTGNGVVATANYRKAQGPAMPVWAATNLSGVGTFAANPWDYGYYFTWTDAQTACPSGWRLPTALEIDWLINKSVTTITTGVGADSGDYSGDKANGAISANRWFSGSGAAEGFFVYPNTGGNIHFPNAGMSSSGSGSIATTRAGSNAYYWSSDTDGSNGYLLYIGPDDKAGALNSNVQTDGFSVRCVRD